MKKHIEESYWGDAFANTKLPVLQYKLYRGKGRPRKSDYKMMTFLEIQTQLNIQRDKEITQIFIDGFKPYETTKRKRNTKANN